MSEALAPLFEPFDEAGLTLKNRIVMSPMTRWKSPAQYPGPDVAAYHRRRAENDVGLIITEGTSGSCEIRAPTNIQIVTRPA
jgi:2,4-dienoyl-CoA reductase-like NADH-dependent reductase (Old Yellow Enzyme family)